MSIISIWQPVGHSTHIIAAKISQALGVKTAHTGTIDPMAQGVIIVLAGQERFKKYDYAFWQKEYEFEIAFGIETDTFDGLGLITKMDLPLREIAVKQKNEDGAKTLKVSDDVLEKVLNTFIGDYEQEVPAYAAIKIKGKPIHWYARNNLLHTIKIPMRTGTITNIKLIKTNTATVSDILLNTITKIQATRGDLRQQEIINQWETLLKNSHLTTQKIQTVKIRVQMTKGLYVRALAQDICKKLGRAGFVCSLTRTKNGAYNKQNAIKLKEYFKDNYKLYFKGFA